jgi:hypothetical protein
MAFCTACTAQPTSIADCEQPYRNIHRKPTHRRNRRKCVAVRLPNGRRGGGAHLFSSHRSRAYGRIPYLRYIQCCKRDRDSRRETRSRVFSRLLDTSRHASKLLDNSRPSELSQFSKKQREGNSRFVSTFLGHSRGFSMVFGRSRSRLGASFATLNETNRIFLRFSEQQDCIDYFNILS